MERWYAWQMEGQNPWFIEGRHGMGRELRRPADSLVDDFPRAHMRQAAMKEFVSLDIENDQNCCWRKQRVRVQPHWQVSWDEWPHYSCNIDVQWQIVPNSNEGSVLFGEGSCRDL